MLISTSSYKYLVITMERAQQQKPQAVSLFMGKTKIKVCLSRFIPLTEIYGW